MCRQPLYWQRITTGRMSTNQTDHMQIPNSKFTDHFAMLNQHEHLSDVEREVEDISQKTMQQPQMLTIIFRRNEAGWC